MSDTLPDCRPDARESVGVGGHMALCPPGLLDDRPELFFRELLMDRMINLGHDATRGTDLDDLGVLAELLPDRLEA